MIDIGVLAADAWPPGRPWPEIGLALPPGDLWVFGYGSLMWRPGFPCAETTPGRIHGAHRAFCVRSVVHRGTAARPGLVLGLDRGGSCVGMAHRACAADKAAVIAYLHRRELVTTVYVPVIRRIELVDGRTVDALAYVVDRAHERYAGRLTPDEVARGIIGAIGVSGRNEDYLENALVHMRSLGIVCPAIEGAASALARRSGG